MLPFRFVFQKKVFIQGRCCLRKRQGRLTPNFTTFLRPLLLLVMMVEMVAVRHKWWSRWWLSFLEKVFTRMKNIWCNLKDTLGIIRSLLQILMKLVEGPQLPRHDNRDTVDGQEWIIVHMSIPRRKTQTGSWWSMRKFSQRRETRPSCAIAWGKFSRKCISFFKAVYFYFCEAAHHISRQTGWKRVYLRGNFLFARLHRPSATSSSQLPKINQIWKNLVCWPSLPWDTF